MNWRFSFALLLVVLASAVAAVAAGAGPIDAQGPPINPPGQGGPPGTPGVDYAEDHVLVKFRPGVPEVAERMAHNAARGAVARKIPQLDVLVVKVGPGQVGRALEAYARNPLVEYVEVDPIVRALESCAPGPSNTGTFSTDPCSWRQWGLENEGASYGPASGTAGADADLPEAWASGGMGEGVTVAVLDSGYDTSHPELSGRVALSADFTGEGMDDGYGHGTWTTSILAAPQDGAGISGAAPGVTLIVGKVLTNSGSGTLSQVAQGITWATDQGADVLSMSLGAYCFSPCRTLTNAVEYAAAGGVLMVAAAGNEGSNSLVKYPAAHSAVIAVAASDANDARASFSNYGEVAAPGVDIFGAFPDCVGPSTFGLQGSHGLACTYDYLSGTSASTPIVAGIAAIVWGAAPGMTSSQVRAAINAGAIDLEGAFDGSGRVSGCGALQAAGVPCPADGSNQPPVAGDVAAAGEASTTIDWTPAVEDGDGDALSCQIASQPADGEASVAPDCSTGTYTPDPGFSGSDSFTYQVSDGNGGSDTGTVSVAVNATQTVLVAEDVSANGDEDTDIAWTPVVTHGDDVTPVCTIASPPSLGTATVAPDCTSGEYSPPVDFHGNASFTYSISDGEGGSDTGLVSVVVSPVNDPPVASDDSAETTAGTPVTIPVLANDDDIDGDTLSVSAVGTPSSGTVVINGDGTVTYTPAAGFDGVATFTYTASDPANASDTATVTVTVEAAQANGMHVADLDASTSTALWWWRAHVTIAVVDGSGQPVSGARVTGAWSDGSSGSTSCTTGSTGRCVTIKGALTAPSATFTVTAVTHTSLSYTPGANTDPDGDSDGTVIVVQQP